MTEERRRLLDSISFAWEDSHTGKRRTDNCDARWMEMYQQLVAYKKDNNHAYVPQSYKEDSQLGGWVETQHDAFKKREMRRRRNANAYSKFHEATRNILNL